MRDRDPWNTQGIRPPYLSSVLTSGSPRPDLQAATVIGPADQRAETCPLVGTGFRQRLLAACLAGRRRRLPGARVRTNRGDPPAAGIPGHGSLRGRILGRSLDRGTVEPGEGSADPAELTSAGGGQPGVLPRGPPSDGATAPERAVFRVRLDRVSCLILRQLAETPASRSSRMSKYDLAQMNIALMKEPLASCRAATASAIRRASSPRRRTWRTALRYWWIAFSR
jgi:hypothetical protein